MNDEHRRLEILKAEEAVRQLAEALARASQSRIEAEEVAQKLAAAQATLEQTSRSLEGVIDAIRQTANNAQAALGEARTQLGNVEGQVARVTGELRGATQQLDEFTPTIEKMVGQAEESLSNRLGALARWGLVSLIFSALAFGSAFVSLLLLLWRTVG